MSRPVLSLTVGVLLTIAAAVPAYAAPSATAGPAVPRALEAQAAKSYAAFRHPKRRADTIVAGRRSPAAERRRLAAADSRLIAKGSGFQVFLVLHGRDAFSSPAGPRMDAELLALTAGSPQLSGIAGRLSRFVADGAWTAWRDAVGAVHAVVLVPDGARGAQHVAADGARRPLTIVRNAVVALVGEGDQVAWTMPGGTPRSVPITTSHIDPAGTPVTATLLDGSVATIDLGNGAVRTLPLTGSVSGFIPGGYSLGRDNRITFTRAQIGVTPTDVLTDGCASPALARIDPATAASLDPARPGGATVKATGQVTVDAGILLRTVLDLRQDNGCGADAVPGGYADTPLTVALAGTIERGTGLARLHLVSAPTPVTLQACLTPRGSGDRCAAAPAAVPATATIDLVVKVAIG